LRRKRLQIRGDEIISSRLREALQFVDLRVLDQLVDAGTSVLGFAGLDALFIGASILGKCSFAGGRRAHALAAFSCSIAA
jgi:hypothetical protein